MAAVVQVQAHEGVAGLQHSQQHSGIGLCARVGLHVGIFCAKQLAHAVDGQLLYLVHHLTAAIVAVAGIAFGIFISEVGAHGLHHLFANEVLTCNELNAF